MHNIYLNSLNEMFFIHLYDVAAPVQKLSDRLI